MTVKAIETINRHDFLGLSTDSKPTDHVKDGSCFLESDTKDLYVFHDGAWNLKDDGLMWVWNPGTMSKEKMVQPVIELTTSNLYIEVDALEDLARDSLEHYKLGNYDVGSDPMYVGYLNKGGEWYIKRITQSTGVVEYVAGSSDYATNWTNKVGLSYTSFSSAF